MKALCVSSSGIDASFQFQSEIPIVGRYYEVEDATTGTGPQNRAFHSLLDAFWAWMHKTDNFVFEDNGRIFDLTTPSISDFKDFFKYKYGAGFSHIEYVDDKYQMVRVKSLDCVPGYVVEDFNSGNRQRVKGVLKSWADYTIKERLRTIDMLRSIIIISGCNDKKVQEIMTGMEKHNENV
jgi:hypothetical protein